MRDINIEKIERELTVNGTEYVQTTYTIKHIEFDGKESIIEGLILDDILELIEQFNEMGRD